MTTQEVKRKLAAILSADVKGYSRLMGEDEVGTIRPLNNYEEVMAEFIQVHRGRVVGTAGDSVLAEFASVSGCNVWKSNCLCDYEETGSHYFWYPEIWQKVHSNYKPIFA